MMDRNVYEKAIENLQLAVKQLKPDGNNCAVCGDDDHQAFECHHNPLSMSYLYREHWRCFHCNAVFYDSQEAEMHFGETENEITGCILNTQ